MSKKSSETPSAWRAIYRFARLSPRKTRSVIGLIRGRSCQDALNILRFNHRRPAVEITKTLKSAMANAAEQEAEVGKLFVREARVDAGSTVTRWRPKDRGRAHPIVRRTSHIHIVVAER